MDNVPDDFNFAALLRTTTTNLCCDAWRRSDDWEESVSLDEQGTEDAEGHRPLLADLHPDPAPTPYQIVERKEMRARLHAALAKLPERQRVVLPAREQYGLSWDEIARLIGASRRTAQYEHERARETLRRLLPDLI